MPLKSIRQALNEALAQEMRRDPTIIVIGEDVAGGAGSEGQRDAYGDVLGVTGQERCADGVRVGSRELEAGLAGDLAEEAVGHLEQDAGAVAGVRLGSRGTAVLQVAQRGERLGDDVVARDTGKRRDERDTAGVVLVLSVVQALRSGASEQTCGWPECGRRECAHLHSPVVV